MSNTCSEWAWEADCESPGQKLVLVCVAENADENGYCWPGQAYIARRTCSGERTVRRHLDDLERLELLKRTARFRKDGTRTSDAIQLQGDFDSIREAAKNASLNRPKWPLDTNHRPNTTSPPAKLTESTGQNGRGIVRESSVESSDISLNPFSKPKKQSSDFDLFWELYPKKTEKGAAERAWNKYHPKPDLVARIMKRLLTFLTIDWVGRDKQFIPCASKWLNKRQWEDEVIPPARNGNGHHPAPMLDEDGNPTTAEYERIKESDRRYFGQENQT